MRTVAIVLGAAALLAGCDSGSDSGSDGDSSAASTVESGGVDWPLSNRDLANTRFAAGESTLTADTVDDLTETWSIDELVGVSGTPVVVDGVAYFGDWTSMVRAVEAKTGDEIWTTELAGLVLGSPAVDGNALYVAGGRTLYRLDRATGEIGWEATTNEHSFAMISASPVVADGLVFQGVASGEVAVPMDDYTFRGSIGAYDAATGAEEWRLVTTPGDDTGGAGVGIWSTPAVDVERGLLYVGTGNTYEEPSSDLADSLLAIDYATGEVEWSTQFTNPDVFSAGNPTGKDADVGAAPNMWTSDGQDLVGAGDKTGVYRALDRDTGDVVWETRLTPGSLFGGDIGTSAFVDGKIIVASNVGNPETNVPTNVAKVFALDPASGEILWEAEEIEGSIYAPVSGAPGIAFVGTTNGALLALDAENGEELWRGEAPDQTGAGPSIVDGNVLWGYGFTLFEGPGEGGLISFSIDSNGA
jgi:polyvinyl alcohol dehydrogenase (cytochrome)